MVATDIDITTPLDPDDPVFSLHRGGKMAITATVPPLPPPVILAPYNPAAGPCARTSATRRSVPGDPSPQRP